MKTSNQPLLGSLSERQLLSLIEQPAHSTLIAGGLIGNQREVAEWVGNQILGRTTTEIYGQEAPPSVEVIRSIKQSTRASNAGVVRVVVIHDVQNMALEAQNALLKLLEEPAEGLFLLLTTRELQGVIDTIASRCQIVELQKPDLAAYVQYFASEHDERTVTAAVMACGGRWDLLSSYLDQTDESLQLAKTILGSDPYQRLRVLPQLLGQREFALRTIEFMANIQRFLIHKDPQAKLAARLDKLEQTLAAQRAIAANGNIKAQLSYLFCVL